MSAFVVFVFAILTLVFSILLFMSAIVEFLFAVLLLMSAIILLVFAIFMFSLCYSCDFWLLMTLATGGCIFGV